MRKPLMALSWALAALLLFQLASGSNEFDDDLTFDDVPSRPEGPGRPSEGGIVSYLSRSLSHVLSRVKRQSFWDIFNSDTETTTTPSTNESSEPEASNEPTTPTTTTTTTAEPTSPEVSQPHTRDTRSTTGLDKSTSNQLKLTDDEDFNAASGSGAEWETRPDSGPFRSESYVIFRIKMYVHEFWVPDYASTHSPAFDKFAKAFARELELFFDESINDDPPLPGSRRATVIGITPSRDDSMLVLVTADVGSKGFDEGDTITHRLKRHLTETSSMRAYTVKIDKDHPLSVQKFTEPNLNGYSECDADQLVCNDGTTCLSMETRCNGRNDCDDGSDEENCPQPGDANTETPPFTPGDVMTRGLLSPVSSRPRCDDTKLCPDGVTLICADLWCDGTQDCPGESEEYGCPSKPTVPIVPSTSTEPTNGQNCLTNEFMCDVNRCIPLSWKCNGIADCNDQTDEESECPPRRE
ncbi:LamB [Nesidiocoris tenuis]|uniref:LamB n=1 Tax=Nesidiocoris tenuis TaxID=355587 RepID=A0ABN7BE87_9HEMI|nr:LamB [Nesidiocoris tenuis]